MIPMIEGSKTEISLDLDGVVFKRFPFQLDAFKRYFLHWIRIYDKFEVISGIDRTPVERDYSCLRERVPFHNGKKGPLNTWVFEFIEKKSKEADLFVNTGRISSNYWVGMILSRLVETNIDQYIKPERCYFKPVGMKSKESKATAIQELVEKGHTDITHYDDNPEDVLPLTKMFPNVKFVIVQDLSTGILFSRKESKKYPNVRRIASFKEEMKII